MWWRRSKAAPAARSVVRRREKQHALGVAAGAPQRAETDAKISKGRGACEALPPAMAGSRGGTACRLLMVGIAACLAAVAGGQDAGTGRLCDKHAGCSIEQGEFCAAVKCRTWEGFEYPCGHCRLCSACQCHSASVDGRCPSHCPSPALEVVHLQGTFVNRDVKGDGSTCLQLWTFEGKSYRRHDTGLSHKEAHRTTYYMHPSQHDASAQTLMPPKTSPCKFNSESGTFTFEASSAPSGAGPMFRFGLKLWKPRFDSEISNMLNSDSYNVETIDCKIACPHAIECFFADGTSQVLAQSVPGRVFAGTEPPRYAEMLDGTPHLGTINMFDTVCKISMRFAPAGDARLVYFTADTGACEIGQATAPDMPDANWARENQDELRRAFPSDHALAHQREQGSGRAVRRANEGSGKQLNISHYDFSNGSATEMARCMRYNMSHCALPNNHSASRCIRYPLLGRILASLGDGSGYWEYPRELFQYDCRCEVGYLDIGCRQSKSAKCGSTNEQQALLRNWPTTHLLYEDKSCTCGIFCVDIDECALNLHNCHPDAQCTNTQGSFTCSCNRGFHGPGVACVDDEECLDDTHNCHKHATCSNTYGSFECACNQGLIGSGLLCEHDSEILVERVWSIGPDLEWTITWEIKTRPHAMDLVSIYKGNLLSSRLVNFFYNSATPCSTATSCITDNFGRGALSNMSEKVSCFTNFSQALVRSKRERV